MVLAIDIVPEYFLIELKILLGWSESFLNPKNQNSL